MVSFEQNRKKDPMVSWPEGSVPQVQVFRSCRFRLHWRRHNAVSVGGQRLAIFHLIDKRRKYNSPPEVLCDCSCLYQGRTPERTRLGRPLGVPRAAEGGKCGMALVAELPKNRSV
jgi:hypothetical protein